MRVISGMRPTGRLHLGHYLGVLKDWLAFQEQDECYFFIADFHALSTTFEESVNLKDFSLELAKTWLACGIKSDKSTIFIQSDIPEVTELYLALNMITPLGWLERNPTYKDQVEQMGVSGKDVHTAGFLTYPVLQAADIILYDADVVPIGEDQKPHLEIAREIVRRFHHLFNCEIFKEPKERLSEVPRLLGLDGRKMSKSYNNAIYLTEGSEEIWQKLRTAKTDTNRIKRTDTGNPDVCLVYDYHKELSEQSLIQEIDTKCRSAAIGCVDCKKLCMDSVERVVAPIRQRYLEIDDLTVKELLESGKARAKEEAIKKLEAVKSVVFNRKKEDA